MQEGFKPFEECQKARSWTVQHVTIGYIGTTGSLLYISAKFFKKLIARVQYLKCCHKFNKNTSVSSTHRNWGIKCLKHKAGLWLYIQPSLKGYFMFHYA